MDIVENHPRLPGLLVVLLVVVHELGHFIVAKWQASPSRSSASGSRRASRRCVWRGTRYSVNDPARRLREDARRGRADGEGEADQLRQRGLSEAAVEREMAGSFSRKPLWVRIAVLFAGVVMNFLLAVGLLAVAAAQPQPRSRGADHRHRVQADSPAAGVLEVGDVIAAADGHTFERASDLLLYIQSHAGSPVELSVRRGTEVQTITVTPRVADRRAAQGRDRGGRVRLGLGDPRLPTARRRPGEGARHGPRPDLVDRGPDPRRPRAGGARAGRPRAEQPAMRVGRSGSPRSIGEVVREPLRGPAPLRRALSINLAVLNVPAVPAARWRAHRGDVVEAARRRRLRAEREALIYATGFVMLLLLVVLITIQDIQRLPGG